jgi:hypothetical protein
MFIPPIALCTVCNQHVVLTRTQQECAREHDCSAKDCPLARVLLADNAAIQAPNPIAQVGTPPVRR